MSKPYVAAKRVGVVFCVASILWLYFLCLQPAFELLFGERRVLEVLMFIVLGIPGGLLGYLSWKLVRGEVTRISIKNALGMFAGMAIFFAAFSVSIVWSRLGLPEMRGMGVVLALFVSIALGLPTYAYLTRALMRASDLIAVKGEFVGRGSYLILAWLLWFILSPIFMELAPRFETGSVIDFGFFLLPILIPYALYRIAVRFLVYDTIEQEVALNYPNWKES